MNMASVCMVVGLVAVAIAWLYFKRGGDKKLSRFSDREVKSGVWPIEYS